jgi:excisionase family DNA binding protein
LIREFEKGEVFPLYLTVKEAAEHVSLSEGTITKLITQKKIRAIFDGEQYLINKDQFNTYFEQMEKYKEMVEEYLSEPIPEDRDIKDED